MPKGFLASVLRLILTSFRQEPYELRRQMPLSRKIRRSPFALALHFLSGLCTFDMGAGGPQLGECGAQSGHATIIADRIRHCELDGDASDFLDGPADQERLLVLNRGRLF